ncbi:hypothetical protein SAMN04488117_10596 [Celeribacter baekdonensis]|uniref:Uncharacterized protein n=1 Tax=Celeribacter baekdonensis TaxID=875171 RepID=A0A1G7M4H8_9RHOB|nr:hypothetical protein [Celeribacter baekdonensis]SDF56698.1 hypothetical protein SAMN04488117_10596 [Celeribacter baekdonensis]
MSLGSRKLGQVISRVHREGDGQQKFAWRSYHPQYECDELEETLLDWTQDEASKVRLASRLGYLKFSTHDDECDPSDVPDGYTTYVTITEKGYQYSLQYGQNLWTRVWVEINRNVISIVTSVIASIFVMFALKSLGLK